MSVKHLSQVVEDRFSDSPSRRFLRELFSNSAQFPIAIILLELLMNGWRYLAKPDFYVLIASTLLQARVLTRRPALSPWSQFFGNLIAPAVYMIGETAFEGMEFFSGPHHILFLTFAPLIGLLQALRRTQSGQSSDFLLVGENLIRSQILFVLYVVFEMLSNPAQTISIAEFFQDASHRFIALATLLLGLSAGIANASAERFLALLRDTAAQLRLYSEWLLGRDLLGRALSSPGALQLSRQRRTILFMDIRGFTYWSERHPPEEIVNLLNRYYALAEGVFAQHQVVKFKFTADEVMAVFLNPDDALNCALSLRQQERSILEAQGLDIGIGLHTGDLVEGLLGSPQLKFYDVIGDTVNTANRIERLAGPGEVWISEDLRAHLAVGQPVKDTQIISLKGKQQPMQIHRLLLQ